MSLIASIRRGRVDVYKASGREVKSVYLGRHEWDWVLADAKYELEIDRARNGYALEGCPVFLVNEDTHIGYGV